MPGTAADVGVRALVARVDTALDGPPRAVPAPVWRLRQAVVCLLLAVAAFLQSPGLVSSDTKLDLTERPGGWLADALRVWTPDALGSLQNQAYGYLFPMGPFHLLGLAAGLPAWVVQRLWWSVLLVAAFLGAVRLAARLGVGTQGTRLLAGLVYALSPRVVTELGALSSEVLPLAALPWVLVPLVGDRALARPRVAAARSGVAVLCAGAVNAAATIAVLPLAAVWLLPGLRTAAGRRLAAWWALATALACSWWVVPLLVQGAYSPPFLDSIETAAVTTALTSPVEVLRGTSHWLGYLAVDGATHWRAGWTLVSSPAAVLDTAVLAALGLGGLAVRSMPGRGRLLAAGALGLVAMSAPHAAALGAPLAEPLRDLLDGPLAPFRNVHKADPLLRLPLALGVAHVLTVLPVPRPRRLLAAVTAVALLGAATPLVVGRLAPAGAYHEIPDAWTAAADWVDARAGDAGVLVVPAAGDAEHVWGRPLDEPLQVLADTPVAVRDAVPLGGPEVTRLLDAVGARIDAGRGSPGLAPVLARAGVRYVVVRNDLDRQRTDAPRPVLVAQALAGSPGLRRVAGFGPEVGEDRVRGGLLADRGLDVPRRSVEVWEVAGASGPPVTTRPREGAWHVAGGPESVLQLADRGLLGGAATVLVGDGDPGRSPRLVVTDDLRRRAVDVGRVRDAVSPTLTPDEGGDRVPDAPADRRTVARWTGVRAVTASSSGADVGGAAPRLDRAPASALDDDPSTAWVTGAGDPVGQWLQVDLAEPRDLTGARVLVADRALGPGVAAVEEVEVRTDTGTARTRLGDGVQELEVPPGATRTLRLVVVAVEEGELSAAAGIRELELPGVDADRVLVLPDPGLGPPAAVLADAAAGWRAGCVRAGGAARCSPDLPRGGEEPAGLDRVVPAPPAAPVPVSGSARPQPGDDLDALLDAGQPVRVTASSRAVPDPLGRPGAAADGDLGTGWTAGAADRAPALTLRWDGQREVRAVQLLPGRVRAARAERVQVRTAAGRSVVDVPPSGLVPLPPGPTDVVEIRVLAVQDVVDVGRRGRLTELPFGVAEVSLVGAPDLAPVALDEDAAVPFACGQGPDLLLDGVPVPTRATATVGDLLALRAVPFAGCADVPAAGELRVTAGGSGPLRAEAVTLGAPLPPAEPAPRSVRATRWDAEERRVEVGAGEEAWLVVAEVANRGWRAELDGVRLEPARLDGWQQAWVLPAGAGGEVRLRYAPGDVHRLGLAVGAVLVLVLLALALLPARRRPPPAPGRPAAARPALALAGTAVTLGLVGGLAGLAVAAVVAAVAVRRARWLPGVAVVAMAAAGALVAWAPWAGERPPAALEAPASVLALTAAAAAGLGGGLRRAPSAAAPAPRPGAG